MWRACRRRRSPTCPFPFLRHCRLRRVLILLRIDNACGGGGGARQCSCGVMGCRQRERAAPAGQCTIPSLARLRQRSPPTTAGSVRAASTCRCAGPGRGGAAGAV